MTYSYPKLKRVFEYYNPLPHHVGDLFLVCCQHILEPQLTMFERLIEFGFNPEKIILIGKAYSTNSEVLAELQKKGIQATQPKFSGISYDQEHKNNAEALLARIPEHAHCIILDDGAELITTFATSNRNVLFAVEQTSSGFRKLENQVLPFPVLNVARSVIKLTHEAPLVAQHLNERILAYLSQKGIASPKILVVGLGPIGESILQAFKQNNRAVEGFDLKYGHTDVLLKIQETQPDVIIGATGTAILSEEDIRNINSNHQLFLISASSSDREFPVVLFRSNEEVHADVVYKNITFVNNGFPFSFIGNRYEMTPIEIEKTMCLLGGAVMYGCTEGVSGTGLQEIPKELEEIINE